MAAGLKAARRRQIETVLRRGTIASQAQLVDALAARGVQVTQATLSRDLEELGAYKARAANGRSVYRLPDDPPVTEQMLPRMMSEFVHGVESSGNLVVVRTSPGSAAPVARAIDTAAVSGVIGTIAGDDTVLVICGEGVRGTTVASRLDPVGRATRATMKEKR